MHSVLGNGNPVWARISLRNVFLLDLWRGRLMGCAFSDEMTYSDIHVHCLFLTHLFQFLFIFLFHVLCMIKGWVSLQDFTFLSRHTYSLNLLLASPLLLIWLWIHNVGPVINVRILQPNSRHLGLLHMNAITPSAVIHPLSCAPSPHLCHSPFCLQESIYFLYLSTVFPDFIYSINNNQQPIQTVDKQSFILN